MRAFFDASVIGIILCRDTGWEALLDHLDHHVTQSLLSDFGRGEVIAAIGGRVRRKTMDSQYADEILDEFAISTASWDRVSITRGDIADATMFVARFELALRLPDAIHIATAIRIGATLLTADKQQYRAARTIGAAAINPTVEWK